MARCPATIWSPLTEAGAPDGYRKTQFIVHSTGTMASAAANFNYFQRGDVVVESTFIIGLTPKDPTRQIMDSTDRADANGAANNRAISVEVVGDGVGPYTQWQIDELIRIGIWAAQTHPIDPRIIPSESASGFGWHVMFGAPGPWTSVRGKVCPGNARIKQLKEIVFPAIFRGLAAGSVAARSGFAIIGAIRQCYDRPGYAKVLGAPAGPEVMTYGKDAFWQEFGGGAIYAYAGKAFAVWGDILRKWRQMGSESWMGYPTSDELKCPDGLGRMTHFEGDGAGPASIYWSPATGAHPVQGWFRAFWGQQGWETGHLGYPTSGEYRNAAGQKQQNFQGSALRLVDGKVEVHPL